MTKEEVYKIYHNLRLDRRFTCVTEINGKSKLDNGKFRTPVRTTIYHNNNKSIGTVDWFVDGRKSYIGNIRIDIDQFYNKIEEFMINNEVYKKLFKYQLTIPTIKKDIEDRSDKAEKVLRVKLEGVFHAFDNDRDYLSFFEIKFPQISSWNSYNKDQPFIKNPISLDTIFDYYQITIVSKYQVEIVESTGSLFQKNLSKLERRYYLEKEYIEVLEQFSKYSHLVIKDFSYVFHRDLDFNMTATFFSDKIGFKEKLVWGYDLKYK
jgi:hypothetical protein